MPSSGARSGTAPSRAQRGAGNGAAADLLLACGHLTHLGAVVTFPERRRNLYECPDGCGLVPRNHQQKGGVR